MAESPMRETMPKPILLILKRIKKAPENFQVLERLAD
jgi:hypothetical protein